MTLGISNNFAAGYSGTMLGSGTGINNGNTSQYLNMRCGCEDCFRKEPYIQELPKPYLPLAQESTHTSFWKRFINKLLG